MGNGFVEGVGCFQRKARNKDASLCCACCLQVGTVVRTRLRAADDIKRFRGEERASCEEGRFKCAWRDRRQKGLTRAFATTGRIGGDEKRGGKWEKTR